jgi:hypothetical protein
MIIKTKYSIKVWLSIVETKGNENINSISYKIKKIQIKKNWIEIWIGVWFVGLKPHS